MFLSYFKKVKEVYQFFVLFAFFEFWNWFASCLLFDINWLWCSEQWTMSLCFLDFWFFSSLSSGKCCINLIKMKTFILTVHFYFLILISFFNIFQHSRNESVWVQILQSRREISWRPCEKVWKKKLWHVALGADHCVSGKTKSNMYSVHCMPWTSIPSFMLFVNVLWLYFSTLGMVLFGCKFCNHPDTGLQCTSAQVISSICECDRMNFDNFLFATVTVFQVTFEKSLSYS